MKVVLINLFFGRPAGFDPVGFSFTVSSLLFSCTLDVSARTKVTENRAANNCVAKSGNFDRSEHGI